jgi:hypothetical protein
MVVVLFGFLKGSGRQDTNPGRDGQAGQGMLVFEKTSEVIQAEKLLRKKVGKYG